MIEIEVKALNGLFDKSRGLMGQIPQPVHFKTRWGIHTFFMKEAIDVAILDEFFKVVRLKKNLNPNRIFVWNPKFESVIELPKGWIDKKKIDIGSTISLSVFQGK